MPHINRTLASLTRPEREALAMGDLASVDGIAPFSYIDGPNGVRGAEGATSFPAALVLAASFDRALATEYGAVLAGEVKAAGANVLLGPGMDILRVPWAGRSSESFGEDPLLNGELGGSVAEAVQRGGVLCIAKHYVANNFEHGRTGAGSFLRRSPAIDVQVDDAALHELYLAPFRRAVERYGLLGLMASYNQLRGSYVAESAELLSIPRRWGFTGVTAPDFLFAVRDHDAALAAGLDLPGLDAPSGRSAVSVSSLDEDALEAIASHVLAAAHGAGIETNEADPAALGTPDALALAERIAVAGTVLLTNDGLLPLRAGTTIAVVDGDREPELLVMGGSASVPAPANRVTRLAASLAEHGASVVEVAGTHTSLLPVSFPDGGIRAPGSARFVDTVTRASAEHEFTDGRVDAAPDGFGPDWQLELRVPLSVDEPGRHVLTLEFAGALTARIGGRTVSGFREASPMIVGPSYPLTAVVDVDADTELVIDYTTGPAITVPGTPVAPHLVVGWKPVDDRITRAAADAAEADVAVIVVGRATGEAMDAESIALPDDQLLLVEAVARAQPRTIVVVLGSGPTVMPWRDRVAAVVHAGNSGERGMSALASILLGLAEPGGRLPFTVPATEQNVPLAASGYPGADGVATYAEGLDVGYRGYDRLGIEPAFAFGHGLGYADVVWGEPDVRLDDAVIRVAVAARNRSARDGVAVPQVYVTSPGERRALRGFDSVRIPASGEATIELAIPIADLADYDDGTWRVRAGEHLVELGLSSRTIIGADHVVIRAE